MHSYENDRGPPPDFYDDFGPETGFDDRENTPATPSGPSAGQIVPRLSLDELRRRLMSDTGIPLSADDPVLLIYAIHRVALDEQAALSAALLQDTREDIEAATTQVTAEMSQALNGLIHTVKEQLSSHTLNARLKAMQEAAIVGNEAVTGMRRMVRWAAVITSLNILAAGVVLAVLTVTLS